MNSDLITANRSNHGLSDTPNHIAHNMPLVNIVILQKLHIMGLLVLFSWALAGCVPAYLLNNLSIGMQKQKVIDIMGNPESTSANEQIEYLNYSLFVSGQGTQRYFVKLASGSVVSYGRLGDFGTTLPERIDVNINKK